MVVETALHTRNDILQRDYDGSQYAVFTKYFDQSTTHVMWKYVYERLTPIVADQHGQCCSSPHPNSTTIASVFLSLCETLNGFDISKSNASDLLFLFVAELLCRAQSKVERLRATQSYTSEDWKTFIKKFDDDQFYKLLLEESIGAGNDDKTTSCEPHMKTTPFPFSQFQKIVVLSIIRSFRNSIQMDLINIITRLIQLFSDFTKTPARLALCLDMADFISSLHILMESSSKTENLLIPIWTAIVAPVSCEELRLWDDARSSAEAYRILDCVLARLQAESIGLRSLTDHHFRNLFRSVALRTSKDALRFVFLGLLTKLASALGNQATDWQHQKVSRLDPQATNTTFNYIDITMRYLEISNHPFTEYQRGALVQHALAMLTHLPLPSPVFVGTFAILDPLIWPPRPNENLTIAEVHNVRRRNATLPDREAMSAFLNAKGYKIVAKVTSSPRCPMQYLAICFRLLLVTLCHEREAYNLSKKSDHASSPNASLIRDFTWYLTAATDCSHLRSSLMPAEGPHQLEIKQGAFRLLAKWPGCPSDLTDRILFALTESNEDDVEFQIIRTLKKDFFTQQSWNRVLLVMELSLYVIEHAHENGITQTFQQLLADSSLMFQREVDLKRKVEEDLHNDIEVNVSGSCISHNECTALLKSLSTKLDEVIENVGSALINSERVETAIGCLKWFHRIAEFLGPKSSRWKLLQRIFESFVTSLGLFDEFYNIDTICSTVQSTQSEDIYSVSSRGFLNFDVLLYSDFGSLKSRLRDNQWEHIVEYISPNFSWRYYQSLILIPLFVLRMRADSICQGANIVSSTPRSKHSLFLNEVENDVHNHFSGGCEMDRVPLPWEVQPKELSLVLNSIRTPLLCIHRCFGTSLSGRHHSKVKDDQSQILSLFTLIQILKAFECTKYLFSSYTESTLSSIKDQGALLLRSFLLIIDATVKNPTTINIFVKLGGLRLLSLVLEYHYDASFLNTMSGSKLSALTSNEMGNFRLRILNLVSTIAEECSIEEKLLQYLMNDPYFPYLMKHADITIRLSLFNRLATPLMNSGGKDALIMVCSWSSLMEALFDSTRKQFSIVPSIREETLSLIYQLLEYENDEVFFTSTERKNESLECRMFIKHLRSIRLQTFNNKETFVEFLLPCCENVADTNLLLQLGNGGIEQLPERCPHCKQKRLKDQVVLWTYNKCAILMAYDMKLRFFINDDAATVRSWKTIACFNKGEGIDDVSLQELEKRIAIIESSDDIVQEDDISFVEKEIIEKTNMLCPIVHDSFRKDSHQFPLKQSINKEIELLSSIRHSRFIIDLPLSCYDLIYLFLTGKSINSTVEY